MKPIFAAFLFMISSIIAAPPTAEDDKAIAGTWKVNSPRASRIYEISDGRTLKISGSGMRDKRERLLPNEDGSYHVKIDDGILRIRHDRENDKLTVEYFGGKDDLKKVVSPLWKVRGLRHEQ